MFALSVLRSLVAPLCALAAAGLVPAQATDPPARPTFSRDVAPILFESCATCHHPGGVGPFSLLSFSDAKKRARQIAEVTRSRYMPPWLPDPIDVELEGNRRLAETDIETIQRWVEQGGPQGDPAQLPPQPELPEGWQLAEPDLVVTPPAAYTLPAEGEDVYRNLVLSTPLESTRYVRAVDIRPGNPRVVHHAILRIDRTRSSRRLAAQDPQPGWGGTMSMGDSEPPDGHFIGWTPGRVPDPGDPDLAWKLEPGTDLVLQLHMKPTGKPETIRPSVGLYFADGPPRRKLFRFVLSDTKIDIAPGDSRYVVEKEYILTADLELISVYPHAHYLARTMNAWARLPDGTELELMHIPEWDFNWQDQYRYAKPVLLPANTRLAMRIVYDNSADNPRNPNHPPRRVRFGTQTTDEMGSMSFEALLKDESRREFLKEAMLRQDVARDPGDWISHGLLGSLELKRGNVPQAIRHFEIALRVYPEHADAHYNLGRALTQVGRVDEAIEHYREALEIKPFSSIGHYNLAAMLAAQGQLDEAIEHYREALEITPDDSDIHNNLAVALGTVGQVEQALRHYRHALRLKPDASDVHSNLGNTLLTSRRVHEAIEHYREALRIAPDSPDVKYNLDIALQLEADLHEAIAGTERSARSTRYEDAAILRELSEMYAAAGRYDRAISTAQAALELATAARTEELVTRLRRLIVSYRAALDPENLRP